MTLPPFLASRLVAMALLSLSSASLGLVALASDTAVEPDAMALAAEQAVADAKAAEAKAAEAEARASRGKKKKRKKSKEKDKTETEPIGTLAAARAADEQDAMDLLRARLADKLGAAKDTPEAKDGVMRVGTAPAASAVSAALAMAAPARPASAPAPAPVVVAHAEASPAPVAVPVRAPLRVKAPEGGASAAHAGAHEPHWEYQGSGGPDHWGRIKPEFAKCTSGTRQSPIDIRDGLKVQLDPVRFDYKPSTFRVIDNGHTVQVNVGAGNFIEVMGRRYELQQFHFHRPSEERINGRQFDMVAHLVHKDGEGRLAVVAVLLEQGGAQPVVQMVWNNLPLEKNEEMPAQTPIELAELLPADRGYFTYMGSLTTPPCSEGVLWMVMKHPVPISPEQIGIFARLYPMNARPIQSASGRMIKESN
ncbi:MAG TPA: carbonic anhydrase family protein [Albitalea sp.]|nr:carbonic anhydrase family protein [Albitalea sp.]